jgi:PASTA domain
MAAINPNALPAADANALKNPKNSKSPTTEAESAASSPGNVAASTSASPAAPTPVALTPPPTHAAEDSRPLVMDGKHRVAVPSFAGESVRRVVENAGTAGLGLQLLGTGIAREQAPAAGTMVPVGTEIVVRFAR